MHFENIFVHTNNLCNSWYLLRDYLVGKTNNFDNVCHENNYELN